MPSIRGFILGRAELVGGTDGLDGIAASGSATWERTARTFVHDCIL